MDVSTIRMLATLAATMALFVGCAGPNSARVRRDVTLLSLTTPVAPLSGRELSLRESLEPERAAISAMDLAHRVEAPMDLHEALRISLQQSGVARVQVGNTVEAARETFYDIQANEAEIVGALAAFDTTFKTDVFGNIINQPPDAFFGPGIAEPTARDELALNFGWEKQNIWGGTASANYNPIPGYLFIPGSSSGSFNPRLVSQLELFFKQPLLKGSGVAVNSAPIAISRIRTEQSAWDFKRTVMASVRSIVTAYWDLHAARVALHAVEEVLPVLEEIVRLQEEALKAEWGTYTEVAKAETQLYGFRQEYQRLQSDVLEFELRLRNLMGLIPNDGRELVPATEPLDRHLVIDTQQTLRAALDNNPDLVRQRLDVRIRTVEQMLAANGVRSNLDVFALYRMNGIGEDLGDAIAQLSSADFVDWQLGASYSVPLGRRQAHAELRAAQQQLRKQQVLLDQAVFSVQHDLANVTRSIEFAYREYEEATRRVRAADQWVKGARLRYQNPNLDEGGPNWLVQNLNEYLNALRFRTEAATDSAALLAKYNAELVQLEERKGTLLTFFGIDFRGDPCRQSAKLPPPALVVTAAPNDAAADFVPSPQPSIEPSRSLPEDRSNVRSQDLAQPATPLPRDSAAGVPTNSLGFPAGDVIHEQDPPAATDSSGLSDPSVEPAANSFLQPSRLDSLRRLPPASATTGIVTTGWGAAKVTGQDLPRHLADGHTEAAGSLMTNPRTTASLRLPPATLNAAATLDLKLR